MPKLNKISAAVVCSAFLVSGLFPAILSIPAANAAGAWQKGATIAPMWNGEFGSGDFQQSLRNLAALHANYVTLVVPLYQSNTGSTDIQTGGNTPTDASLISGITYAHSLGLHVMVKPLLDLYTGEWRAYINPSDRTTWFTNYGNMISHYAQIAQAYNVEDFCIGTELIDMSTASANSSNTQNWQNLIAKIRGIYSGQLTYGANWGSAGFADEKNAVQFWSSLDYIGISAYFNLYGDDSVQNLENDWAGYNSDIQSLSQRWGKPIVFTEIGYRSVTGAHTQPWDYNLGGPADQTEQSNDYQALFTFWSQKSYMQGVELWQWSSNPNAGGAGDTGYTPQNKSAQTVISQWFNSINSAGAPPPGPISFAATASVPSTITVGQPASISTIFTNRGNPTGNIVLDVEVYNSSNQKVFQQFFNNQNFTANQSQTYSSSWTPSSADAYTVKLGVFNNDWTQNYLWVNSAATMSPSGSGGGSGGGGSGGGGSNPPPASSSLNIWWPSNGVTVSGVQPFKAMMTNMNVNSYNIYWQVDGGGLVAMSTNNTDYPHKEFDVDLSQWTWHGNGPYSINFVAKDLNGSVLAQQAVNIYVTH